MITEKGTIKTSVKQDERMYGELNKNIRNVGIFSLIAGAVVFVCGVLILCINISEQTDVSDSFVIPVLSVLLIFLGVFYILLCKNTAKNASKMNRVEELEFFDGYLIEKEYTDGEHTSTNKVYYKWLVRIRETKNYLFLYNTRVTAVAVDKNSLPPNELSVIRALLKRAPQPAPAQTVQDAQNVQNGVAPAAADVPPAEPIADTTDGKDNKEE